MTADDLVKHYKRKEWSFGNGQCPECYGCRPGFFKWQTFVLGICHEPEGHKKNCPLSETIKLLEARQ